MKKVCCLLLLAGMMLPAVFGGPVGVAPANFTVTADKAQKSGQTWTFKVKSPEVGSYRMVVYGDAGGKAAKPCMIKIELDNDPIKERQVIAAGQNQGRIDALRVVFKTDAERTIVIESPNAAITKLDFVGLKVAPVPAEAMEYRPAVTPPATRPRVLVNPEILPEIRRNLTIGENLPFWERVKAIAVKPLNYNPPAKQELGYDGKLLEAIRCKAFYYLMTKEASVGKDAVDALCRYMAQVDFGLAQDISREIGESVFTSALVYDWCNELLTAENKKILVDRYYYFAEEMEIGWPPFLEPALYGHANEAQISRDLLSMAIAMYEDQPEAYNYCSYALMQISAPAKDYLYQSGRHDQGTSYGQYRFCWDMHAALMYERMNGYQLFDKNQTAQVPYRWIYLRTPDGKLMREGDEFFRGKYFGNFLTYLVSYSLFQDPLLKAEYAKVDNNHTVDPLFFLLLNDPNLRAEDNRAELPLTRYYPEPLGGMVARTGWNFGLTSDDVVVSMLGAGYHYRNHHHLDAGSFQIYYRGLLLADLGHYRGYGNPSDWNFNKSSASHTLMLVRDPEHKGYSMGRNFSANSGTQEIADYWPAESLTEQLTGDKFRNGQMLAHGFGPDYMVPEYSFIQMELALAYRSRVDAYQRNLIFLNLGLSGTPAAMIVYDELKLKADRMEPIFQLTGAVAPTAKDDTLTYLSNAYGRSGKLFVKTLLPRQAEVKIQSGKDVFTVDGKPFVPGGFTDFANAGSRALITAKAGEDKTRFLNVLLIQDGKAAALPVDWSEKDGRMQVCLADRVVNFGRAGRVEEREISFKVEKDNARLLFLDVLPGEWTVAKADGDDKEIAYAVPEGRSLFIVLDKGEYKLTRTGAVPAAAPAVGALYFGDDKIEVATETTADGKVLLPLATMLKKKAVKFEAADKQLSFENNGEKVTLWADNSVATLGDFAWNLGTEVKRAESGEWYVPAAPAAAMLNAVLFEDEWTKSLLLKPAESKYSYLSCSVGDQGLWQELWESGRARWYVAGKGIVGDVILKQAEKLAGVEFLRGTGATRQSVFKLEVSADGKAYTTVFDGVSSGKEAGYEKVEFAPTLVRAIRITLNGTTLDEGNSLLGVKLVKAE